MGRVVPGALAPVFGEVSIAKLDRERVEAFVAQKLGEGKAPKSVSDSLGLLQHVRR